MLDIYFGQFAQKNKTNEIEFGEWTYNQTNRVLHFNVYYAIVKGKKT